RAGGSYWRTGIQLDGCGDWNRVAVDSPDSFDRYWKMRSTCLFAPPAVQPELNRFSRDTDYWRWEAVSSGSPSGNFGYSVQTTRRERNIIAQRNRNEPSLRQIKPLCRRSALANEVPAALRSHARRVHSSGGNVASFAWPIGLLRAGNR